ncbi:MAG: hypothetical protein RL226_1311 [Bacteroidota bacterium]
MGIVNDENFQIVYSDTPGVLDPQYKLQEGMMRFVQSALQDADVLILVTDTSEDDLNHPATLEKIAKMEVPLFILINKVDLADAETIEKRIDYWKNKIPRAVVGAISALHKFNTENILQYIVDALPESPAYFPKDELTDKPMRFFVSEMIREKILLHYKQEIPYSCEVIVSEYKEEPAIVRIRAEIIVARDSQKGILIGHQGKMLKRVGTEARRDIESFIDKKVFLEIFVKVDQNWRNDESKLKRFGYLD